MVIAIEYNQYVRPAVYNSSYLEQSFRRGVRPRQISDPGMLRSYLIVLQVDVTISP